MVVDKESKYRLESVISIYSRRTTDSVNLKYYLEKHEVITLPMKTRVLEGKPLTDEMMFSLGSFLRSRDKNIKTRKGLLPDNLMYIDGEYQTYIWHKKEHVGKIHFDKDVGLEDGRFVHPGLIFKANSSSLFVYAIIDKKPRMASALYRAPYLNMYETNNICKGDIDTQRLYATDTHADFMRVWEILFFESKFSAGLGMPTGFGDMLKKNRAAPAFDTKTLKKLDMDMDQIIPQ